MAHLLRVGDSVINLDQVTRIQLITGGDVCVNFANNDGQGHAEWEIFSGPQAQALREWLKDIDNAEYCAGSGGSW